MAAHQTLHSVYRDVGAPAYPTEQRQASDKICEVARLDSDCSVAGHVDRVRRWDTVDVEGMVDEGCEYLDNKRQVAVLRDQWNSGVSDVLLIIRRKRCRNGPHRANQTRIKPVNDLLKLDETGIGRQQKRWVQDSAVVDEPQDAVVPGQQNVCCRQISDVLRDSDMVGAHQRRSWSLGVRSFEASVQAV